MKTRNAIEARINEKAREFRAAADSDNDDAKVYAAGYLAALYWVLGNVS